MNTLIDLTGQRFGKLLVVEKAEPHKTKGGKYVTMWKCKCDCGNETVVATQKLRKGHTTSCGCVKHENRGRGKDLIGQKFGKLTVIGRVPKEERKNPQYIWICKCDCGNEVISTANKLTHGIQVSCGCQKAERIGNLNRKYKNTDKHLYGVYKAMINRCIDEKDPSYINYGGRGVSVCDEWLNDYDAFAEWAISSGYEKGLTLDREDNEKSYSPENCRWVTMQVQQNNKRNCRYFDYGGETHTIAEWARIFGYRYGYLYNHLIYMGETLDEVINKK